MIVDFKGIERTNLLGRITIHDEVNPFLNQPVSIKGRRRVLNTAQCSTADLGIVTSVEQKGDRHYGFPN